MNKPACVAVVGDYVTVAKHGHLIIQRLSQQLPDFTFVLSYLEPEASHNTCRWAGFHKGRYDFGVEIQPQAASHQVLLGDARVLHVALQGTTTLKQLRLQRAISDYNKKPLTAPAPQTAFHENRGIPVYCNRLED